MANKQLVLFPLLFSLAATSLQAQGQVEQNDTTLMQEVRINGQRGRISYRLDRQRIDASRVLTAQGGTARNTSSAVPPCAVSTCEASMRCRSRR